MSDKDEIKELFQKELGNYQAKVNPNLWNGIQAGLGSAGAATGAATSIGLAGKIAIGISIAAAVTVGTFLVVNNEEKVSNEEQIITDLKSEDSVNKESIEQLNLEENKINLPSKDEDISLKNVTKKENIKNTQSKNNDIEFYSNSEKIINKELTKENKNTSTPTKKYVVPQTEVKKTDKIEKLHLIKDEFNNAEKIVKETAPQKTIFSELSELNVQIEEQENQYVYFNAEGVPNDGYIVWDFGDGTISRNLNPEHFFAEAGTYNVTCKVKTQTEEITKNIKVEIDIQGEIEKLPNVFTPNGDGNNDEFFVTCKNIESLQLTIIDNQQNIIYSTNDVDFRWNGFDKSGKPVKEGTYYYIIVAKDKSGNTINKYQQLRLQR